MAEGIAASETFPTVHQDFEKFYTNVKDSQSDSELKLTKPSISETNSQDYNNMLSALLQQNAIFMNMLSGQNAFKNYNIMPDFSKSVGNFNGSISHSKEWLKSLESAATLHNWPQSFILETARTHLKEAAESWYKARREESIKWREIVQRVQLPKDVNRYFHDKVRLCRQLDVDLEEIKEQIAIGLLSEKCAEIISSKFYNNEDDIFKDILTFGRINSEREARFKFKTTIQLKKPSQDARTNLVDQQVEAIPSYRIEVDLQIKSERISIAPILDTGSPISLIIENLVPSNLIENVDVVQTFQGINNSKLHIGKFNSKITACNINGDIENELMHINIINDLNEFEIDVNDKIDDEIK
ncbi:hypothetical protein NQ314_004666 [Rhamnusium bicolor]|uniref:Retrotransposon gag domain-containing protein n=1 Tax=Rhamnusium bicolor TaxID=1586634 RepID=A0AAV8ZIE5_9CUCU|nr:hypothetical protein NQ314_004666 [Rhamnusium bicolor]